MSNLTSRIVSAVIALVILFLAIYFGRELGVYVLALLVVMRGSYEMARMFFVPDYPALSKYFFMLLNLILFLIITHPLFKALSGVMVVVGFVVIVAYGIFTHRRFSSVDRVLTYIIKCCAGILYCCYLPASIIWTLQTNFGLEWFFCLLAVVFAGDIGAFIFGSRFGKTKVAPQLSPKKSLEGALGGLAFSTLAALVFTNFLPHTPIWILALTGFLGGALGQVGDFFESLVKRVAGVKDSGSIMPGHGGVLDRLDGVLLSGPLFYLMAAYFSL